MAATISNVNKRDKSKIKLRNDLRGTHCCVSGCSNYTVNTTNVSFYRFPNEKFDKIKREKWIQAVGRGKPLNEDNSPWRPGKWQAICSVHFVGGKKVDNPKSPSYLPTLHLGYDTTPQEIASMAADIERDELIKLQSAARLRKIDDQITTNDGSSANINVKEEPIDYEEFVNSDQELVRVQVQLQETPVEEYNYKLISYNCELNEVQNLSMTQPNLEMTEDGGLLTDPNMTVCNNSSENGASNESSNPTSSVNDGQNMTENLNSSDEHTSTTPIPGTSKRQFVCVNCEKSFISRFKLQDHNRLHHPDPEDKGFLCSECGSKFVTRRAFNEHRQVHREDKVVACTVCHKQCTKITIKKHMECHPVNKLECVHCGVLFKQRHNLNAHVASKHDVEVELTLHMCILCGKGFSYKGTLNQHLKGVHGENEAMACVCGKKFSFRSNLTRHTKNCEVVKTGVCRAVASRVKKSGGSGKKGPRGRRKTKRKGKPRGKKGEPKMKI